MANKNVFLPGNRSELSSVDFAINVFIPHIIDRTTRTSHYECPCCEKAKKRWIWDWSSRRGS